MNRKTKKDVNQLKNLAEISLVDKELHLRGRNNLDKMMYNINEMTDSIDTTIEYKKDLLQKLKSKRNNETLNQNFDTIKEKLSLSQRPTISEFNFLELKETRTIDIDNTLFMTKDYNHYFAKQNNIDLENPFFNLYSQTEKNEFSKQMIEKFDLLTLDNNDYGFAVCAALIAGVIDIVFIGTIKGGKDAKGLQKAVDNCYSEVIKKYSKFVQESDFKKHLSQAKSEASKNKIYKKLDELNRKDLSLKDAISHLEKHHKVSYDAPLHEAVSGMRINNHHNSSLAHDFSPLGLIFGIIDQLTGKASFIDPKSGEFIRTVTENKNKEIQGDPIQKIIEATNNWFGHCLSDISGSSSSKGRGMGLPAPFWSYLQKLNFGNVKLNDKADTMTIGQVSSWMYEQGYDFRAFTTELIPIIVFETLVRCYWFYKQYLYYGKTFIDSLHTLKKRELSRLILVSASTFTTIDSTHAVIKSTAKGGNTPINLGVFLLTVNKPGLIDCGFRSYQNVRNELKHRKYVEYVFEQDILTEYKRITKEIKIFE